jgi:hypothetical protein
MHIHTHLYILHLRVHINITHIYIRACSMSARHTLDWVKKMQSGVFCVRPFPRVPKHPVGSVNDGNCVVAQLPPYHDSTLRILWFTCVHWRYLDYNRLAICGFPSMSSTQINMASRPCILRSVSASAAKNSKLVMAT